MFSWHPRWACFEEFLVPGQYCLSSPLCVQTAGFVEGEQMSSSHPWQFLTWVSHRPSVTVDTSLEWKRGFKPFSHKMAASLQGITPPAPVRRPWTLEYFHFIQYVKETDSCAHLCYLNFAYQHQARDWTGFIQLLLCLPWKWWIVLKLWIVLKWCHYYCDSS